ncbi:gamma-glutamyltranspeptidase/glutathione hydrolase [Azospirillum baldaniorum]|uniref:gamma-glutamyltransferase n=1 Tax=Azospirillum baldaniorum TaxID=1064539 RepID=UPI0011ABAF60|nr:gamma-glutamyltransferase [Azospirillum baldaniorum]TWA57389.1 gamma-glutamyltranspeptidase/glutathione hydrolase [Azospirillum baldaniorum]
MPNDVPAGCTVYGRSGMVVAGHPLAAMAGWRALDLGGSVADAAVAAAAVLGVALPHATTVGGDLFALVHEAATGRTHVLNASGPAPAAARAERFRDGVPQDGIASLVVPGAVAGLKALHERFGRRSWAEALAPAVAAAEDGVPVSGALAAAIVAYRPLIERDAALAALLLPGGRPLAEGTLLRQPALAATLAAVAADGPAAFYEGRPAHSLGALSAERGGLITAADLAAFRPEWVEPLSAPYLGLEVRTAPPNSYGVALLLQLQRLAADAGPQGGPGSVEHFARLIPVGRDALAAAAPYLADPAFGAPDVRELLARGAAKGASGWPSGVPGGTAVVTVADAAGNGVVLIESIFTPWGSGVHDPATGILFNNRVRGFAADPAHPNVVAPGKRPAHTLSPALALEDGRLRFLLTTPGGPGQTLTLAQVLVNRIEHGLPLAAAVAQPRWSLDLAGRLLVEETVPDAVVTGLAQRGLHADKAGVITPYFGSAELIERLPDGVLAGVPDQRRDAAAIGA